MRELNAYGKVGHTTINHWLEACQIANAEDLVKEAEAAKAIAEDEKDSPSVWIDAERYSRVLGEHALTPKPLPKGQPKRGTINPKFIKPKEEDDPEQRRY
jgi:ribosomal protein L15